MKNTSSLKLYTTLTICTAFIFCFSYVGNSVYGKVFNSNGLFTANTQIGSVNVSDISPAEALSFLGEERDKWKGNTKIRLNYKEKELELDLNLYNFQIENSIEQAESGKENQLIVKIDDKSLKNLLTEISAELTSSEFNFEQLIDDLLIYATRLELGSHQIKLLDYFPQGEEDELVAESIISLKDGNKLIQKWTNEVAAIEIKPHSQFLMLKTVEEKGMTSFDQKTLSMISSAIYKTVLSTNFDVTERHIGRSLPDYIEAGYEAKVDKAKNMDFILTNPNDQKYSLQFKYIDNLLYVSLKGSKFIYQYNVSIEDEETFKPKKIIQYDAKLQFGEKRTEVKGVEGLLIKVNREIVDQAGNLLRTELISEDFYPPVHEVIVQSLLIKETTGSNSNDESNTGKTNDSNGNSTDEQKKEPESNNEESDSGQNNDEEEKRKDGQKNEGSMNEKESDIWGKQDEPKK